MAHTTKNPDEMVVDKITPEERNRRRLTIPPKFINLDKPWVENLWNAYQVDQAIMDEPNRLVVIRFGSHDDVDCQVQDHALLSKLFPTPSPATFFY